LRVARIRSDPGSGLGTTPPALVLHRRHVAASAAVPRAVTAGTNRSVPAVCSPIDLRIYKLSVKAGFLNVRRRTEPDQATGQTDSPIDIRNSHHEDRKPTSTGCRRRPQMGTFGSLCRHRCRSEEWCRATQSRLIAGP
jgi:hypothetical protein